MGDRIIGFDRGIRRLEPTTPVGAPFLAIGIPSVVLLRYVERRLVRRGQERRSPPWT